MSAEGRLEDRGQLAVGSRPPQWSSSNFSPSDTSLNSPVDALSALERARLTQVRSHNGDRSRPFRANELEEADAGGSCERVDMLSHLFPTLGPQTLFPPDLRLLCGYAHGSTESSKAQNAEVKSQQKTGGRDGTSSSGLATSPCGDRKLLAAYMTHLRQVEQWRFLCVDREDIKEKKKRLLKQKVRAGVPDSLRGVVWQLLAQVHKMKEEAGYEPDMYYKLATSNIWSADSRTNLGPIIARDINRTFPKHVLFRDIHQKGQQALFNVLKAYAIFNPDVGYCQGMGFLAGILLMYMTEEDAFYMLVCLLHKYNMQGLFTPGLPTLEKYFFQFQRLFQKHMPRLSVHFRNEGVEASMYLSGWMMTLFAYNFSFDCVVKIWDVFLNEGEKVLFRTALAILKIKQEELFTASFEAILEKLKSTPGQLDADVLLKTALSMKVHNSMLRDLEKEYFEQKDCQPPSQNGNLADQDE
ncbi:TBC domain-containing protein [Besnoitia besnoiti]|uniref:TBC domain-containing protein n=1 Tax=Besnoitia besnoiti TaxID=94643 RepID=A0A2A9MMY1_BESBE|nr:TBC domain-containing protein [Besnoitia besnoiti]PFH37506.1 TBC domain-containing protein [Besnoitia besnoiti]